MPGIRQILILFAAIGLLAAPGPLRGESGGIKTAENDSILHLDEVLITASRRLLFQAGFHQEVINAALLQRYSSQGLDQLLSRPSGIFIKSYGPGILSTSSMRGGSASHSSMLWNGFSLQSPMSGQLDISLLPSSFFDQVSVQYGGGSALWGSGAMGGVVFLDNHQAAQEGLKTQLALGGSNIGELSQAARISFAANGFSAGLRMIHSDNKNQYRYTDNSQSDHPVLTQSNAGLLQKGFLNEISCKLGHRHRLQWHWWWQENKRHIPPALQQTHTGAIQEDKANRITASWQSAWQSVVINTKAALFDESIRYTDSVSITTLNTWQTLAQETDMNWQVIPELLLNAGLQTKQLRAASDEYAETHQQQSLAGFFSAKWELWDQQLHLMLNLRQEYIKGQHIPLVPSFGLAWQANPHISIRMNAGKNYRLPSLNDLYWVPGGNPELKPESGWSQDIIMIYRPTPEKPGKERMQQSPFSLNQISISLFNRYVNNWIIWLPKGGGMLWSPENIMEVHSRGMEVRIHGHLQQGAVSFGYKLNYDLVRATNLKARSPNDRSVGKQLIYVPEHRAGLNLSLAWKSLQFFYDHQYSSRIYTSSDNSNYLPYGQYADLGMQWQKPLHTWQAALSLSVVNIWNAQWMVMPARPMPLRYFRAGLIFEYNNTRSSRPDGSVIYF